jgi:2-amino-4-hydroxy-6-hydroxymethyldihydropteridine diphosphokinase
LAAGFVLKRIYLSLGSNLGDRQGELLRAIDKLHRPDLVITKISSIWETAPVGFKEQPAFLNVAVEAETSLLPMQLLHRVKAIERERGRKKTVRNGPRVIDVDILLYGSFIVDTLQLQIPHPRMQERRFVLEPLAEIATDLRHPVTRQSLRDILAAAPHQLVRRTALRLDLPRSGSEQRP